MTSRPRHTARSLDDARVRSGIAYGLTDYRARLGSEGEVVALCIGNYWFAEIVYEITLHPRPASRSITGAVETDQPLEASDLSVSRQGEPLSHCGVGCSDAEASERYSLHHERGHHHCPWRKRATVSYTHLTLPTKRIV